MAANNTFPYEVKLFTKEEYEQFKKHHEIGEVVTNLMRVGPKGYVLPEHYKAHFDDVRNFTLRSDDVFIVSYPRSGSTVTKDLVWLITNDLDFEKAKSINLELRVPYFEVSYVYLPPHFGKDDPYIERLKELATECVQGLKTLTGQRLLHSHLPMSLLPEGILNTSKVIYVARDMRDVAVSYYHMFKALNLVGIRTENFKTYYEEIFSKDLCYYSPYFEHVKEGWKLRNHPNMLILFYEELCQDLKNFAKRVADFLGKTFTDQQLDQLYEHLKFDNFQKNESVDLYAAKKSGLMEEGKNFIRKGKVGGWREHFDEEMTRHAENWISKELQGTGLSFPQ